MRASASTDEELAARTAAGDLAAFSLLYDRYAGRVRVWAVHALGQHAADDALQEVFLRVWRHAGQFDANRGRFVTWLMAIARHHIARQLDRRGRRARVLAGRACAAAQRSPKSALAPARRVATTSRSTARSG